MKLFIKLLILLVIVALAGPFFLFRDNKGESFLSMDTWLPTMNQPTPTNVEGDSDAATHTNTNTNTTALISWSKDAPAHDSQTGITTQIVDPAQAPIVKRKGQVYRWKDKHGVWQFSDEPNQHTPNIVVSMNTQENVIQSLTRETINTALGRQAEPESDELDSKEDDKTLALDSPIPIPSTIPMAQIPELINQAKDVQSLMNDRIKRLNEQIDR